MRHLMTLLVLFYGHKLLSAQNAANIPASEPNATSPGTDAKVLPITTEQQREVVAAFEQTRTNTTAPVSFTAENAVNGTAIPELQITPNDTVMFTSSQSHNASDRQSLIRESLTVTNRFNITLQDTVTSVPSQTDSLSEGNSNMDHNDSMKTWPVSSEKSKPTAWTFENVVETTVKNEPNAGDGLTPAAKARDNDTNSSQQARNHLSTIPTDVFEPLPSESETFTPISPTASTEVLAVQNETLNVEDFRKETSRASSSYYSSNGDVAENSNDATFIESRPTSSSRIGSSFTSSPTYQQPSTFWNSSSQEKVDFSSPVTSTPTKETSINDLNFEDFFNLTSENVTRCLENNNRLQFLSLSGQISFVRETIAATKPQNCSITLTVPGDMVLSLDISFHVNVCSSVIVRLSHVKGRPLYKIYSCPTPSAHLETPLNNVTVLILLPSNHQAVVDLSLSFTALPRPRLEVEFTSPTTGYVQSPRWDGKRKYTPYFNERTRVNVPANHSVMISFFRLNIEGSSYGNCVYDRLTISEETLNTTSQDEVLCNTTPFPKPEVFHTNNLSFHFVSDSIVEYPGFKLLFSFHHHSAVPEKTSSGLWNCSVAHWPQFQQHIGICNTIKECYAGEDETNCTHVYQDCGYGILSIGARCYELVVHDRNITWNEAANECLLRDSYLANLNTANEWNGVLEFMNQLTGNKIYFGLHASDANVPHLYRRGFQWSDETVVFHFKIDLNAKSVSKECSCTTNRIPYWYLENTEESNFLELITCDENITHTFLCEKNSELTPGDPQSIQLHAHDWSGNGSHVLCPKGHVTFSFLACDVKSECLAVQRGSLSSSCNTSMSPQPPSFACNNGVERVPYTLVCDHRPDCSDNSDENFCFFPPCQRSETFQCNNKQCVLLSERCDNIEQCLDGSDERQCPYSNQYDVKDFIAASPPVIIDFNGNGFYTVQSLELTNNSSEDFSCPETHFRCPGNETVCMPVFVKCNGVYDCPGRQDEVGCDSYVCPGFYRCRASTICVHSSHVCDGVFQCPQRDDELLCDSVCPENCICQGLAFFCTGLFPADDFPELRFLDGTKSLIKLEDLRTNVMLVFLNIADCGVTHLSHAEFPNLRRLDLSRNRLETVRAEDLSGMNKLQVFSLAGNPLTSLFVTTRDPSLRFPLLQSLDVSDISLVALNVTVFSIFPGLLSLNLSGCGVERLAEGGFQSLTYLRSLDVRRCPLNEFPRDVFGGLLTLTEVWADNYKLCCPGNLPESFNLMNCHAPSDEISSCDALLRSDFYRIMLSLFTVLALVGNLGSFVYRVFVNKVASNLGFDAFVTHLCASDFLMGLYLAVIGVADRQYMGTYLWNDTAWKSSAVCKMAGFLSLLSSEVSAFIICLITLDRFLVLRFPFSRLHFRKWSAHVACGIAWLVGVILAGIPLLPMTSHWEFYSQNGICIPLPITRNYFAGHTFSFVVMIIVNFVLFVFIAAGQVFIYWSVRTNSMTAGDSTKKSQDLTIARRLITIAMSDFLCWFPIGLLGVLASTGVPIPGEVNVAVAIIILPVNSAINPFLYTINMLLERRSRAREKRIQKMVMSAMASKNAETAVDRLDDGNYTKAEALGQIRTWIAGGLLSLNNVELIITEQKETMNQST